MSWYGPQIDLNPPDEPRLRTGEKWCPSCRMALAPREQNLDPCSCGASRCCWYCEKCHSCDELVCPDCSVDISPTSQRYIVCAKCYAEELKTIPTEITRKPAKAAQLTKEKLCKY